MESRYFLVSLVFCFICNMTFLGVGESILDEHKNLSLPLFIPVLANIPQASEDALFLLLTYDHVKKISSVS